MGTGGPSPRVIPILRNHFYKCLNQHVNVIRYSSVTSYCPLVLQKAQPSFITGLWVWLSDNIPTHLFQFNVIMWCSTHILQLCGCFQVPNKMLHGRRKMPAQIIPYVQIVANFSLQQIVMWFFSNLRDGELLCTECNLAKAYDAMFK
jgi:hypothetical protein